MEAALQVEATGAHHHRFGTGQVDPGRFDHVHGRGGRTRHQRALPVDHATDVGRIDALDILVHRDVRLHRFHAPKQSPGMFEHFRDFNP